MKAAAHQSLNCIEYKKIKYGEKRFSIWRMEFLHPAMWHDHDIYFARLLHPRPIQPFILTGPINRLLTCRLGVKAGRSHLSGGR